MTAVLADSPASRVRDAVGVPVEERRQGAPAVTKRYSGGSARMWEQSASCDLPQREYRPCAQQTLELLSLTGGRRVGHRRGGRRVIRAIDSWRRPA
jgi:hypothetical protein